MKVYQLTQKQFLPIALDEAWKFFSNPRNLRKITPESLDFVITNDIDDHMYPGQIICYTVRPILGIKVGWMTEITQVQKPYAFIDEQRFGPYKFWHHRHTFQEVEGGVEIQDDVHYALGFGIIGRLLHAVVVKEQLENIFTYRREVLKKMFH